MWNAVITNVGNNLLGKTMGGTEVSITKAKAGSGVVSSNVLKSQTSLVSEKQMLQIDGVKSVGGTSRISVLLSNTGLNQPYTLNQIGFYANDPDYGEILFAIAQNSDEKVIPKESDSPLYTVSYNFHFAFSGSTNITAEVETDSYITRASLSESNDSLINTIKDFMLEEKKKEYHVGKLILTENSTNPAVYLGFGTWELYGSGRVPVGFKSNDSDFNQIGKTGGEKAHALTTGEIASHTHTIPKLTGSAASSGSHTHTVSGTAASNGAHTHTVSGTAASNGAHTHYGYSVSDVGSGSHKRLCSSGVTGKTETTADITKSAGSHTHTVTGTAASNGAHTHTLSVTAASNGAHTHTVTTNEGKTGSSGSGTAHNNLQPYFVCYIWKRVS